VIFKPFIIFSRKTFPKVLTDIVKDGLCYIGGQDSGWISGNGFHEYIKALVVEVNDHLKNILLKMKHFFYLQMATIVENVQKH